MSDSKSTSQITGITRRNIIDELLLMGNIHGRLDFIDFLKRVWPLDEMPSTDSRFNTATQDLWQHMKIMMIGLLNTYIVIILR